MKKIFIFLSLILLLSACRTNQLLSVGTAYIPEETAEDHITVDATQKGIETPLIIFEGTEFQLTQKELINAVTSFVTNGEWVITPATQISRQSTHEGGVIVLEAKISGGDIISVSEDAGWTISKALFSGQKKYPDEMELLLKINNTKNFCINVFLDERSGNYTPKRDGADIIDCFDKKYKSNQYDVYLDKLYIDPKLIDPRSVIKTSGVELPRKRN